MGAAVKLRSGFAATEEALEPGAGKQGRALPSGRSLLRLVAHGPVLSCADQSVVSATNFLTLVMLAWWTSPEQVGVFALGMSIVGAALTMQDALVSLPYAVQRHRPPGSAGEHAFCCVLNSGLYSAVAMLLLVLSAVALAGLGAGEQAVTMAWVLAAVLPLALSREFARDFALARLEWNRALALDVAASAIQLSAIVWLGLTGRLSPLTALGAMGVGCGVATLAWFCLSRPAFTFRLAQLRPVLRQNWQLGRWLLVSRSAVMVQGYSTYWISAVIAGPAVTGVYAACMSIVAFANPIVLGLYNFFVPKSVLAFKDGGVGGLRRRAFGDALMLGTLMGAFLVAVFFAGEQVMGLLYPGGAYEGHGLTLAVLTLGAVVAALAIPASNALASMERPRPLAAIAGLAALLNVVLVWMLIGEWGLLGAAAAIVAANLVGTSGRWVAFLTLIRNPSPPAVAAPQEQ
jgi:O-antigen/teichoic acid export membrane protein